MLVKIPIKEITDAIGNLLEEKGYSGEIYEWSIFNDTVMAMIPDEEEMNSNEGQNEKN